jgi:thermostable 8-oxoguanine DNA glycosylase
MTEIPEYVGYANDLVEKVGKRLEDALKDAVAEMATKSDVRFVEERARQDREEIAEIREEIKADKAEAIARGRRIWRAMWSVVAGVFVALAPSIFTLVTQR